VNVTTGTLCRLIPLDVIDGQVIKYRVEHGDVGEVLGVVVYDVLTRHRGMPVGRPWKAWYSPPPGEFARERLPDPRLIDRFYTPEAAALRLAAERFVKAEEAVNAI
jgi:hypothetical protein